MFKNIFNSLNDHSIGTKIKWLIFPIAILPLIVLSLTMLSVSKQALIKQLDENTQAKLIDISSHIQSTYDLSIKSLIGELNAFEYMLFQNGTPEIINNKLTLKSSDNRLVINDDNSLVEKFFGMFGNRATIFQVIGNEAIRVSTNIRLDSGKLAIGTRVSQQVFETVVNQQQQYIGFADVVGNPYLTVYSPLYNASGKVIGIIFVGIKEVELFKKMLSTLEQLEFGHSGQVFIIDENTNWIIEPDLSKRKNSVSEKEIIDEWFFRTKVGMQQPVVTETVENGHALKQWYLKIPKLNWTIVAYIYPEEFMQPINQNKDTMIAVVVFLIALIAIITHIISRRVSNKAQSLGNLAKAIKENDLTKAKVLSSNLANNNLNKDEFQIISNALNEATESLHFNQTQIIELKERYRQFFEVNSSVKLVINPETGSIVEANSAALEFYGYDHKTITTMNISDINCLTEEQITRERQSALNEQRLYFEFKHKLANGEIKEVEVYSGPVEVNGTKLLFSIVHDVSQKNFQARELEEERFRLRSIVEGTDAAIWEWDHQSQTVRLNEKWLTLLGYEMLPSQAITASAWRSRIHIKDLARFEDEYNKHLIGRSSIFNVTIRHISVSGKTLWIKHRGRFMNTASQREKVLYCASVDVTELVEKEQQALLAAEKFEAIANATMAGVLSLDKDCKVTYINEQFTRMFGFDFESLTDLDNWIVTVTKKEKDRMILSNLTKQGVNQQSFEINMLSSDGQLKDIMLSIVKSQYSVVATFVDITEQKKRENTIQYVANHDTLTGLYNRVSFTKHLNLGLKQSSANNNMVCILFIDLDGFKKINDTYGHDAGDKVLQIVANRMAADVRIERGDDVVARLGGDEFTAMLVNVKNKFYCEQIIQRILHSIDEPIMFNEASLHVTSSIGAVIIEPNSDLDSDAILRQADHAMYQAKRAGKNRFVWFEKEGFEDLEQSSEVSNVYEIKSSK